MLIYRFTLCLVSFLEDWHYILLVVLFVLYDILSYVFDLLMFSINFRTLSSMGFSGVLSPKVGSLHALNTLYVQDTLKNNTLEYKTHPMLYYEIFV